MIVKCQHCDFQVPWDKFATGILAQHYKDEHNDSAPLARLATWGKG